MIASQVNAASKEEIAAASQYDMHWQAAIQMPQHQIASALPKCKIAVDGCLSAMLFPLCQLLASFLPCYIHVNVLNLGLPCTSCCTFSVYSYQPA